MRKGFRLERARPAAALALLLGLASASPLQAGWWPFRHSGPSKAQRSADAAQAAAIYGNPLNYVGQFSSACSGFDGDAAQDKARQKLMESIQVSVKSSLVEETGYKSSGNQPARITHSIQDYVSSSVNMELSGIRMTQVVENYPLRGQCAVIAYIGRADADGQIRAKIKKDRESVASSINVARAAADKGEYAQAIESYVDAGRIFQGLFQGMPVLAPLTEGAPPADFGQSIASGLNGLLSSIRLKPVFPSVLYTAAGRIENALRVTAVYEGPASPPPVSRLPLEASLWAGGKVVRTVSAVTDDNGMAEFRMPGVNAEYPSQRLSVTLDTGSLSGLRPDVLPSCQIQLSRRQTAAYGTWVRINGRPETLFDLGESLRRILDEGDLMAVNLGRLSSRDCSNPALSDRARGAHADYLLVAWVTADARKDPQFGVDGARAESGFSLCRLSDSKASSGSGPGARGMGSDLGSAGWQAASKASARLIPTIRKRLSRLSAAFR